MDVTEHILCQFPADCRSPDVCPLGSAGGMSGAQFWRIDAPRGRLILRRWPRESPTPARLEMIHAVLQQAGRSIGFVPTPITTLDGKSFISVGGFLWELAPWMPGEADFFATGRLPVKQRAAMVALAKFHLAVADFPNPLLGAGERSLGVVRRLERLRGLQQCGLVELLQAVDRVIWPELAGPLREFLALADEALPLAVSALTPLDEARFHLQPCLRDVWHDHVLFVGEEVAGLVDFGAIDFDTRAGDVARLLGSLAEDDADAWRLGLTAYEQLHPLSADERRAVFAMDASGTLLAGCNWARWVFAEARKFDDCQQVVQRVEILLKRLKRMVQRGGTIDSFLA